MTSIRERALSAPSRKHKTIRVEQWDAEVAVMELDAQQRLGFLAAIDPADPRVDLAVLAPYLTDLMRDPDNLASPVFEAADTDLLLRDHPGIAQRVLMTALDLSEIDAEAVEVAEGNSDGTPNSD